MDKLPIKSEAQTFLYQHFKEFISLDADRFFMLKSLLDGLYLSPQVITISGNRHIFLSSNGTTLNQLKRNSGVSTILIAHYDRAPNSPGANDNSVAVFELIEAAVKLKKEKVFHWFIIFTDKEELSRNESIREQGSYTLAKKLQTIGLGNSRFYIFDACGVGDTLIISTMADHIMKNESGIGIARKRLLAKQLRSSALETARKLQFDKVSLIPTPFSDDVGFLRAGIVAQTITMLPENEAVSLRNFLQSKPDFADALVNRQVQNSYDKKLIPETWRLLNGPEDDEQRLTPQNFSLIVSFIYTLCKMNY